jgi:hypothetical protein
MDAKDYAGAKRVLNEMLQRRDRLNGNEVGQVYNMLGFVYFSEENYGGPFVPTVRCWPRARTFRGVSRSDPVHAGAAVVRQRGVSGRPRLHGAVDPVRRQSRRRPAHLHGPGLLPDAALSRPSPRSNAASSIARERGMEIKEQWWALLNFLYFEQENWPKVLEILEILVRDFPKREYWMRLAGIHGQEGNDRESLWTYEAADAGGFLDPAGRPHQLRRAADAGRGAVPRAAGARARFREGRHREDRHDAAEPGPGLAARPGTRQGHSRVPGSGPACRTKAASTSAWRSSISTTTSSTSASRRRMARCAKAAAPEPEHAHRQRHVPVQPGQASPPRGSVRACRNEAGATTTRATSASASSGSPTSTAKPTGARSSPPPTL